MTRTGLATAATVAMLAIGCSGGDTGTPTSPSINTGSTSGSGSAGGAGGTGGTTSCRPAAPTNLRVSVNGSMRVFTWDPVANILDYTIQVGSQSGGSDQINTNTTQPTFNWNGQGPGTYYARVSARNSCGSGANSAEIVFN